MADFKDYVWASVFGGKTPYDPNNTLFTKAEERGKERRAAAAREQAAERDYARQLEIEKIRNENAVKIERMREDAAAKRRKDEVDYQLEANRQAREEAQLNRDVSEIEKRNAERSMLYRNADAAARWVGMTSGFKPRADLSPEENEADAQLVISRANAMAYRYHENQVKGEQDRIRELQDKLFEARTPTDAEVGPAVDITRMPKSIASSIERQNLLRAGKIDKAVAGLPAADQGMILSEVARVREEMAAVKAKSMTPQIAALTAQLNALSSRNAESTQKGKDMRDGISNGKPVWMMVPSEAFRGGRSSLGPGVASAPPDDIGDRDAHMSALGPASALARSADTPPVALSTIGMTSAPTAPTREDAVAAGMAAIGIDPAALGGSPVSDIGSAFVQGLREKGAAGAGGARVFGIPITADPATVTDLTPDIAAAASWAKDSIGRIPDAAARVGSWITPENIRLQLEAAAAPVRDIGNSIGAFLNPSLRQAQPSPTAAPGNAFSVPLPSDNSFVPFLPPVQAARPARNDLMDRIPRIELPSTNSFVPFLPPVQVQTPAEVISDYLFLRKKYGDIPLPTGNAFPFVK